MLQASIISLASAPRLQLFKNNVVTSATKDQAGSLAPLQRGASPSRIT